MNKILYHFFDLSELLSTNWLFPHLATKMSLNQSMGNFSRLTWHSDWFICLSAFVMIGQWHQRCHRIKVRKLQPADLAFRFVHLTDCICWQWPITSLGWITGFIPGHFGASHGIAPLRQSNILTVGNNTLWERALLNTFQNLRVSSPAPVTMASPSGDTACEHHKNKKLKSWKCWWGHCILVMHANFRICVNQSQPALQIVEKLAMPLTTTVYKVNYIHQGIKDIN